MSGQFADWSNVCRLLSVAVQGKALRDLPDENLSIIGTGSNNSIIKWIPGWNSV